MSEGRTRHGPAAAAWVRMAGLAGAVLAADQATKALVRATVERGDPVELALGVQIVNVRNPGIAFGLLADGGALLLIVAALTLGILLCWFALGPARPGLWLGVGLLVGGALGNLVDRIRDGEVTDFLDLPLWPAFNVADVAITAGVIAIALIAFAGERGATGGRP